MSSTVHRPKGTEAAFLSTKLVFSSLHFRRAETWQSIVKELSESPLPSSTINVCLSQQPWTLLSSSSRQALQRLEFDEGDTVMTSEGVKMATFWRGFYKAKELTIAAIEKCAKLLKKRTRHLKIVRKMQVDIQKQLEGLSRETESLDYDLAAIGFSNYAKILQLKIRYQMTIDDSIMLHRLKLGALMAIEQRLYESLKEVQSIKEDNEDVLDDLLHAEEALEEVGGDPKNE